MKSRDAEHFERLYAEKPDPWDFATSPYETQKYNATMAALHQRRFKSGFEIGCSIGVLTRRLAAFCDNLLAVDIVESALTAAQSRCADLPQVRFSNLRVPENWPAEKFDIIVLSEVLYFLNPSDIRQVTKLTCKSLLPGGLAVLVNYTEATGDPTTGNQAAEIFIDASHLELSVKEQFRGNSFRLEILQAAPQPCRTAEIMASDNSEFS